MKEKYIAPECEIISMGEDVITTSTTVEMDEKTEYKSMSW